MLKNKKIGFIGGGNMAEAIIKGMLSSSLINGSNILVSEPNKSRQSFLISEHKIKVNTSADKMIQDEVNNSEC